MPRTTHHPDGEIPERPTVLFYDGECGLCHRCVAWCLRHDRAGRLRFAPLQGDTYADLDRPRPDDLSTMVLLDEDGLWTESDAVLATLRAVGGGWRIVARVGRVIPRSLRNAIYRFVAKRRLGWFGPADSCRLPDEDARESFLP